MKLESYLIIAEMQEKAGMYYLNKQREKALGLLAKSKENYKKAGKPYDAKRIEKVQKNDKTVTLGVSY